MGCRVGGGGRCEVWDWGGVWSFSLERVGMDLDVFHQCG